MIEPLNYTVMSNMAITSASAFYEFETSRNPDFD
jgi:hypothetical protein